MRKFTRYSTKEAFLIFGLSIVVFLISCGLVGYGIHNYYYLVPWDFLLMAQVLNPSAIAIWFLGIFGMVAGLVGIVSVARLAILQMLIRKRHTSNNK